MLRDCKQTIFTIIIVSKNDTAEPFELDKEVTTHGVGLRKKEKKMRRKTAETHRPDIQIQFSQIIVSHNIIQFDCTMK